MFIFPAGDSTTAGTSAQVIPLTPNCAAALKISRKRLGDTDNGVWVDAVCINQSDVAEKNVQVTMMADIYSLAKCVVVPGQKRSSMPSQVEESLALDTKIHLRHGVNRYLCGDKKTLHCLAEAPYWTRVWTLQEVAHSHAKLLCANDHVIDLKSVFDSVGFVVTCRIDRPGFKYHEVFFRSSQDPQIARPFHWSKELHIYYMSWFISIKASNPRDKIYATRGQFARTFGKITVHYNRSISSLFADATKQIICEGSDDATGILQGIQRKPASDHFSEDLKRLVLTGTIVDPEEDMTKNPDTTKAVYDAISSWASDLTAAAERDPRSIEPDAVIHNSTFHSFSNLLYLMNHMNHKRTYKALQWTPRNSLPIIIKSIASESGTLSSFCIYLGTSRLFLTTDGHCGCGPWGLEPGDLICVFSGLQFPFAVRPQGSDYILVAAAIVDGVMDGEMWPDDESKLTEWEFV
ncbi:hypothetical protein LA080_013114 [Diaporthe eres]|nr:hypothetical protein LA080_013114 [Diaporthe eres]